jgi:sulfur carrier protein
LDVQIQLNGQPREIDEGATIAVLLAELNLLPAAVAVEVNLYLVPRGHHAESLLSEGDRVEIVSLVGGG